MTNLPTQLEPTLASRLADHVDAERKLGRALESLGPLRDRDVALLDGGAIGRREAEAIGARVTAVASAEATGLPEASMDAVLSLWSAFRGPDPAQVAEADRILRPGGRLLVVHDYGRDDISRLRPGDHPEYGPWSRREGPFLAAGWRIRVVHCWWTFDSLDDAATALEAAFGTLGADLAAGLTRPRLSYNVAIYHRSRSMPADGGGESA
ncbi:MAG TPA: methyltransferase domain-containing protein [Candidatus Limnocylindrales bacterium]|nr:methyltransferase domain-containing protein [Candidatus Limnocylindrales bacterium]